MTFGVEVTATVVIDIPEDSDVLTRVTGPGGDEWRAQFYPLRTTDDVLEHIAFNAVANDILDINRLEGWADVDPDEVDIRIDDVVAEVFA